MRVTVKLPRMGEAVDEVVIMGWEVAPGQDVVVGDVLLRVETDKAVVEVPSPVAGVVLEQLVVVDSEVVTGTPLVVIDSLA